MHDDFEEANELKEIAHCPCCDILVDKGNCYYKDEIRNFFCCSKECLYWWNGDMTILAKCAYCHSRVFEDEYYRKDIDDNYFCCSKCMDCYNEMVLRLPSNSVKV
jgi:hypothetical protein